MAAELGSRALTFSLSGEADITASNVQSTRSGLSARLHTHQGAMDVSSRLLGGLNLYNFLAAVGVGLALGLDKDLIADGLKNLPGVPGRLERVGANDDYLVLVDYAHTDDALSRVLEAVRALGPRRLLTVFGCGGDRDRTKRPKMGRAAGNISDLCIVTSDNPRTEEPLAIIGQIEKGLTNRRRIEPDEIDNRFAPGSYTVIPDRRTAIKAAVGVMQAGDILVIAGKGHENYQILGRTKIHFDDREEALAALKTGGKS